MAETDYNFLQGFKLSGGIGKIGHRRKIAPVTSNVQGVVRTTQDVLVSFAVFDLNCPVTIQLPPNEGRYLSLYALDNEQFSVALLHSTPTKSASITISYPKADKSKCPKVPKTDSDEDDSEENSREKGPKPTKPPKPVKVKAETRYVCTLIRIFVDPNNATDVLEANRLQDAVTVSQASVGNWTWADWNTTSLFAVRNAIAGLAPFMEPYTQFNGYRGQIDETLHYIGTATGWGGNPAEEAVYYIIFPPELTNINQVYYIDIDSPSSIPIGETGFWSVTVYNSAGYLQFNNASSYVVNSVTAKTESNGSIRVYLSNTRADYMKNWIYIFPGWNYCVRLYLPQTPILTNTWTFPALQQL